MVCTRYNEFCLMMTVEFVTFRLAQPFRDDVPFRIRSMHVAWFISFWGTLLCKLQFDKRREQVKNFTNIVLKDLARMENEKKTQKNGSSFYSIGDIWANILVLTSFTIMWTNPPVHAATVLLAPCAPYFLTSLLPACEAYSLIPQTPEIFKFQLVQFLMVFWGSADMFLIWTFNWMVVFLGLTSIRQNIGFASRRLNKSTGIIYAENIYKSACIYLVLLKDGFATYLQIFPFVLFSIIGILVFGTIRYRFMEFHAYLLFPFCSLRCLFDGASALSAAGKLNQTSLKFLKRWDQLCSKHELAEHEHERLGKIRKSWRQLNCSAGSLYTFENSIVLVSLNHCVQLMFNLLITY